MVRSWIYFESEVNNTKIIFFLKKQKQNKEVGLYQMEKLLHSKQNHPQNEEAT